MLHRNAVRRKRQTEEAEVTSRPLRSHAVQGVAVGGVLIAGLALAGVVNSERATAAGTVLGVTVTVVLASQNRPRE